MSRQNLRQEDHMSTTPIENIIGYNDEWLHQAMEPTSIQMQLGWKCVEFHEKKLGKKTSTFTGSEFRFSVWVTEKWTVYVNNKKGVCLEVPEGTNEADALAAWEDYRQKMLTTS